MPCQCAACKAEMEISSNESSNLPKGWFLRVIDHDDYILCDVCGHDSHFTGGLSAYLADCLSLPGGARCMNLADSERFAVKTARKRPQKARRAKRQI